MKQTFKLLLIVSLLSSCGGVSPEEQAKIEKEEIETAKEQIDDLFEEVRGEFFDDDNLDLHNTSFAREIAELKNSKHKEIAEYAEAKTDSISSFINRWKGVVYDELLQYAEEQGWNKLSADDFKKLEKQIKVKSDEFASNVIYRDPASPKYVNMSGFFLYYFKPDESSEKATLVLKTQYYDDDWLFIKNAKVSIDGGVYTTGFDEWDNDHSGGMIYEWSSDIDPGYNLVVKILKSKKSKIRFTGRKYYDDRTITNAQRTALKRVLKVYYGLYVKDKVDYQLE